MVSLSASWRIVVCPYSNMVFGTTEYSGPFSAIASEFAPLKKLYPEVTTLTTAHIGGQYGGLVKSPLPFTAAALRSLSIDAVTPQTNYLPPKPNITEVQAGGRQVWTYISVQPYKPWQDWRLDNPLIDARAIFWMISAFRFDGLLHWGLNQWGGDSSLRPIAENTTDGFVAQSAWNMATSPGSWMHGDGKLLYCGQAGPIASSRLANVRDGQDDYAYIELLRALDPHAARELLGQISDGECASCAERDAPKVRRVRELVAGKITALLRAAE